MNDLHTRLLRGVARRARERLAAHRAASVAPATRQQAEIDGQLERAVTLADAQLSQSAERRRRPAPGPSVSELDALATSARLRLALHRRKRFFGRGRAIELAELEQLSVGAEERARRARRGLR